jgi:mannose-6-phosphate isomerase-like protein (cupin superfamily)
MTYPPVRYAADEPASSARHVPSDVPPDLVTATSSIRYLAGARHGDAELGVFRYSMGERRSGPDPHFHRTMSESFFVLSGSVRIFDGRVWLECTSGDFVHVPPGGVHGFRNESGAPVDMLILFAPGAPREGYFEELAEIGASGRRLDDAEWVELYARHDQYPA